MHRKWCVLRQLEFVVLKLSQAHLKLGLLEQVISFGCSGMVLLPRAFEEHAVELVKEEGRLTKYNGFLFFGERVGEDGQQR